MEEKDIRDEVSRIVVREHKQALVRVQGCLNNLVAHREYRDALLGRSNRNPVQELSLARLESYVSGYELAHLKSIEVEKMLFDMLEAGLTMVLDEDFDVPAFDQQLTNMIDDALDMPNSGRVTAIEFTTDEGGFKS